MRETLGYMVTFRTYGTWLQGHVKGFVKDGDICGENIALAKSNVKNMKGPAIRLSSREKKIVRDAIIEASKKYGQKVLAIAVQSNHVHIVCEYIDIPIGVMVARYKSAGRIAVCSERAAGKIWATGYDRKFCFDEESLETRVAYVQRHGE